MRPRCVFCRDQSRKAGKLLKCLHSICNDCLPASVDKDGRIHCAKCRIPTPCPPPARSHEQLLVDDSILDRVLCDEDESEEVDGSEQRLPRVLDASIGPESTASPAIRSNSMVVRGPKSPAPQHRRVHICPFHSKMAIRYYCSQCRDVLCDKCKHQHKHTSKGDIAEEAAAVRHRLTERFRNIIHKTKDYEVDASLQYAEDLLEAFRVDVAGQVANVKRLIHESCDDQRWAVKDRRLELKTDVEMWREEQADCQAKVLTKYTEAQHKANVQQSMARAVQSNEDCLKLYPNLVFSSQLRPCSANIVSRMKTGMFACEKLSKLESRIGTMGKVVDNTDIDLSMCSFKDEGTSYTFSAAAPQPIVALVRNSRGEDVSAHALRASSIQIWANGIEVGSVPAAPVRLPITYVVSGEVHTLLSQECTLPTVFCLELRVEPPCPSPELCKVMTMTESLKTLIVVYPSGASHFDPRYSSPRGFIETSQCFSPHFGGYLGMAVQQVKNGVATIRASKPVEDRYSGPITIEILSCESSNLDIGFTWDCTETGQEMKLVFASSAKERSFPKALCGCVAGDVIYISRCSRDLDTYNIVKVKNGDTEKMKKRIVRVDTSNKPILMVRMSHSDTAIWIAQYKSVLVQVDNT